MPEPITADEDWAALLEEFRAKKPFPITPLVRYRTILAYMERRGVGIERAKQLAMQLYEMEWEDTSRMSVDEKNYYLGDQQRYWNEWAEIGKNADQEAYNTTMAMYQTRYDPKTGMSWTDLAEQQEREQQRALIGKALPAGREGQLMQIGRFQAEEQAKAQREWREEQPAMPSGEAASAATVAGLRERISPAASKYFERELPGIYSQAGMPEKRRAWWEEKTKWPGMGPGWDIEDESGLPREQRIALSEERGERAARQAERQALPDPWTQFLSSFNFMEKFKALTPAERGFYPSKYRPRTRVLR